MTRLQRLGAVVAGWAVAMVLFAIVLLVVVAVGCARPAPAAPKAGGAVVVRGEMACFIAQTLGGGALVCTERSAPCEPLRAAVDAHKDVSDITPTCVELEVVAAEPAP